MMSFLAEEERAGCFTLIKGSFRQVCVKFNDFSRTSKDFPTVFKD